jgi:hypothetical protein
MEYRFHKKKLYQRVQEGDLYNGIVCFSKSPYRLETDGNVDKIIQWKCQIYFDLWIITIALSWNKHLNK